MAVTGYYTVDNRKDATEAINNTKVSVSDDGYTNGVSSDKLTNSDFLKLMIQELKMQDPTKPMDSDRMMDNQLKMSTIEANLDMSSSMDKLRMSFESSSLSTAANMIGKIAEMETTIENENGETESVIREYKIRSIQKHDGELFGDVQPLEGWVQNIVDTTSGTLVNYDTAGFLIIDGQRSDIRIRMDEEGMPAKDSSNRLTFIDDKGEVVDNNEALQEKYLPTTLSMTYGELETLPLDLIQKISDSNGML